ATVTITVNDVNDAPDVTNTAVQGVEDSALVFSWASLNITDIDNNKDNLSIRITSLPNPANGQLQYFNNGQWDVVTVGMLLTSAMFDAGSIQFVPSADQADGGDSATGLGNQADALASFNYIVTDGSDDSLQATVTIHIDARADVPELAASAGQIKWGSKTESNQTPDNVIPNDEVFGINIDAVFSGRNVSLAGSSENNYISAGVLNDTNSLQGGSGDDVLVGGNHSDNLHGGAGNDVFIGGGLNDSIYGGAGVDTAIYSGNFANYTITNHLDHPVVPYLLINDSLNIDASSLNVNELDAGDHLYNVERLVFADAVLIVNPDGTLTQVEIKEIPLSINTALTDTDGSEYLSAATIDGIPNGVYLTAGTLDSATGTWTVPVDDLANLKLQVTEDYDGELDITLTINVIATESSNGSSASNQIDLDISLRGYNYNNGTDGDNTIETSDDHDIIVSDTSGIQIIQGENYNIAFILDSSGSMSNAIDEATSQLLQVFQTLSSSATGVHSGVVNVLLVDFDYEANISLSVNLADPDALTTLTHALNAIDDNGWTNYESAFDAAIEWFRNGDAASNDGTNLTYFITDGEPNYYMYETLTDEIKVLDYKDLTDKNLDELLGQYTLGQALIYNGLEIIDASGTVYEWKQNSSGKWNSQGAIGKLEQNANGDYFIAIATEGYSEAVSGANSAFQLLQSLSDVEAIGIGGIALNKLTPYDSDGNVATNIDASQLASVILGSEQLLLQGDDTVNSGDGNDIIFGDLVKFDGIDGQGYAALQKFVALQTGENLGEVSVQDVHEYISANASAFDVSRSQNDGDDVIAGNRGDDLLFGQGGEDELRGGSGNDSLYGGEGNDELIGGSGNDTLIGGLGDDIMTGNAGADTFAWSTGPVDGTDTTDHITDFNLAEDKLDLSDILQGDSVNELSQYISFTDDNGSTSINIDTDQDGTFDQHIILDGIDLFATFGAHEADIISGLLGNNGEGPLIVSTSSGDPFAVAVNAPDRLNDDLNMQGFNHIP
ncbi:type I secretion C-terminal target domain-containing protein, partial [Shewanella sp. 10N.286.45.A1]|uniref:type I secretion C-terminal target domain-containing protein n=1 Tax=Shewanella sp. 10N.286.45.A1 TaxID=3229694 RepID=UPI0035503CF4